MPLRTILILFAAGVLAFFAALNWGAFTAPTTLRFGFGTVDAPLGLIMLGLTVLLAILFLAFVIYLQTTVLIDARRHARELQAQRALADESEASRYSQLRHFLEDELQKAQRQRERGQADVLAKLDQLDRELRTAVEQSANTLAAYVGEVDDFLKRKLGEKNHTKLE
jgi:uncharacterized integral membrane protein